MTEPFRMAVIAGEASGDLLGADLVAALRRRLDRPIVLSGVGGPALSREGLVSLFDYSELSIMGLTAVLARLPKLIRRISQSAQAIIDSRPDVLVIIDSPDFTHRVARKVRKALPGLKVIDYVCPSVWAWKEYRAPAMRAYIDHVLAILPFEPEVLKRLEGPDCTYVGHRLRNLPALLTARAQILERRAQAIAPRKTILLLPGSRTTEIRRLIGDFRSAAEFLNQRGDYRFVLPTVPHQAQLVASYLAEWPNGPELVVGEDAKWQALAEADAAIAASGTVTLELALAGIPTVSCYRTDFLIRMMLGRIRIWSASLPNLIADYPVVPEFFDGFIRPGMIGRIVERLAADSDERKAMLAGYETIFARMSTDIAANDIAANAVLRVLDGIITNPAA